MEGESRGRERGEREEQAAQHLVHELEVVRLLKRALLQDLEELRSGESRARAGERHRRDMVRARGCVRSSGWHAEAHGEGVRLRGSECRAADGVWIRVPGMHTSHRASTP